MKAIAAAASDVWNLNSSIPLDRHRCSFALLPPDGSTGRFAYVSLGTQIELFESYDVIDTGSGQPRPIDRSSMFERLLEGHVGVVISGGRCDEHAPAVPDDLLRCRDQLRLREATARQALQQIGLDQMTSLRGASDELFDAAADLWDTDLAILIDVATTLTAGADRQRYLDPTYQTSLASGRRAALRQLANRSVQSNVLLSI